MNFMVIINQQNNNSQDKYTTKIIARVRKIGVKEERARDGVRKHGLIIFEVHLRVQLFLGAQ